MKLRLLIFSVFVCLLHPMYSSAQVGQTNLELANQFFNTGEFDKAIVYYDKVYDQDPFNAYPNYLKSLINLKDYDKAEKLIKKHQKKTPDPSIKIDLGSLYELQGETDKATKIYQDAIKNLDANINSVNQLGNAFTQRQLYQLAEQTYLQGRKVLKGAYPFSFELAEVYAQQGRFDLMVNEYVDVLGYNPGYIGNIQTILQNKIGNDLNGNMTDVVRQALLRKIQKNPQDLTYSELLYWLFLQEKDYESAFIQAKSLDKRQADNGERLLSLGRLCVSNEEYSTAQQCFQYVVDKGAESQNYVTARIELINAVNDKITKSGGYTQADLLKLDADYRSALTELGKSAATAQLIRGYAHLKAFYLHDSDGAVDLLTETVALPNIRSQFQAECKLELADIYVFSGQVWDAALLYGQVDKDFKNDAIGREAKFRNARLSYYLGEFDWAKDQLNVLKAATSQLISNDALSLGLLISDNTNMDTTTDALLMYSRADLLEFQNKDSLSMLTLDSVLKVFPGHSLTDDVVYKKAEIFLKEGKNDSAAVYFQKVTDEFGSDVLADDALFRLADLYQYKLNDKEKAKQLYEKLLTVYPGSLYSVDARKRFRTLRGDKVN